MTHKVREGCTAAVITYLLTYSVSDSLALARLWRDGNWKQKNKYNCQNSIQHRNLSQICQNKLNIVKFWSYRSVEIDTDEAPVKTLSCPQMWHKNMTFWRNVFNCCWTIGKGYALFSSNSISWKIVVPASGMTIVKNRLLSLGKWQDAGLCHTILATKWVHPEPDETYREVL